MATLKREPAAELVEQLKKAHGRVVQLEADEGDSIVVRLPTRAEFKRFISDRDSGKLTPDDVLENLVRTVSVWPEAGELEQLFNRRPGLPLSFGQEVLQLAGMNRGVQKKEL